MSRTVLQYIWCMKYDILGSADQRRVSDQHYSSCDHQAAGQQRRRTGQQNQVGLFMRVNCEAYSNECVWRDGLGLMARAPARDHEIASSTISAVSRLCNDFAWRIAHTYTVSH